MEEEEDEVGETEASSRADSKCDPIENGELRPEKRFIGRRLENKAERKCERVNCCVRASKES